MLQDLIQIRKFQAILDSLSRTFGIGGTVVDELGNLLTHSGTQDLCRLHRSHPLTSARCRQSDLYVAAHLDEAKPFIVYKCAHGLTHVAAPIIIEGKYLGNMFISQFFLEESDPRFFKSVARECGFEEKPYLEAVSRVPILTREQLERNLAVFRSLVEILQETGTSRLRELEREKLLKDMQRIARLGSWELDFTSQSVDCSEETRRIIGFGPRPSKVGYDDFLEAVYPDDRARVKASYLISREKGTPCEIEHRIVRRSDGQTRFVRQQWEHVKDENGTVVRSLGMIHDITDHKRAEDNLRQSEERYRSIFENSVEGIFQSTPEGRFITVNRALANIHGFASPEEMIACVTDIGPQLYVRQEDRQRYVETLDRKGMVQNFECQMYRKDGSIGWISLSSRAIRESGVGKVLYFQGIVEDITYKREADEALRESEERYRLLFENSADGILLTTTDGDILAANAAASRMFDRTEEELRAIGRPGIMDPSDPLVKSALQTREQTGILRAECPHKRKDGTQFFCEVTSNVFRDKDGQFRASTILRDVTAARKAEEERKELETQLRQARKMEAVGTLAGGIAHEFNNILGIILGNAELALMEAPDQGQLRGRLQEIEKASFRARDMIKQLLSFSRKAEVNRRPLGTGDLFRDSLKLLRASIPSSVEIRQDIPPDTWTVLADPTQLNQVLINLCTNASDAMQNGGGILEVKLCNVNLEAPTGGLPEGRYVKLSVKDTGTGIPAEFLDRIYDPYFTTKEIGKGTGLGLAVVHGIVQDHEGKIAVESALGKGTTFHVFLPALSESPVVEAQAVKLLPRGSEGVLFIDDEPSIASMAKSMLERLGYRVEAMTDPVEAVELFGRDPHRFQLVITDTTMPKMTGDRVVRRLLKIRPDLRIIICTGYSELVNEEKAREMGTRFCLMKPLNFHIFANTVRKVLDEK